MQYVRPKRCCLRVLVHQQVKQLQVVHVLVEKVGRSVDIFARPLRRWVPLSPFPLLRSPGHAYGHVGASARLLGSPVARLACSGLLGFFVVFSFVLLSLLIYYFFEIIIIIIIIIIINMRRLMRRRLDDQFQ